MKKTYLTFIIILYSFFAHAQINYASSNLNANNVDARFSADGNHFWDGLGTAEYEVPSGSNKTTIFTQTLWVGGVDASGQLKLAADRYSTNGKDFFPGPISNQYDSVYDAKWNRVWSVNKYEIDAHIKMITHPFQYPNYQIPASILEWPAHGNTSYGEAYNLAPFVDINNDGIYNPQQGDHPKIKGDQAVWMIMNDARHIHTETGGEKIGLEIATMAYAYSCNNLFNNVIYMKYTLTNRSSVKLHETCIGIFTDFDIGYAQDDYVGCDVQRGLYYGYNGNAIDGNGLPNHYGTQPPAQGVLVLNGPYLYPDGLDNPKYAPYVEYTFDTTGGYWDTIAIDTIIKRVCDESINGFGFGDSIVDNECGGLYGFITLTNTGGSSTNSFLDPSISSEYYNMLNFRLNDSTHMMYGGGGTVATGATGPECRFMYPGYTDPCYWGTHGDSTNIDTAWTEQTVSNTPYDRRALGVFQPFEFQAGGSETIEIALIYARDSIEMSVPALKAAADEVKEFYLKDKHPCEILTSLPESIERNQKSFFTLYPNPVVDQLNIYLEEKSDCAYEVYDISGRIVDNGILKGSEKQSINTESYLEGMYFIRVQSESNIYTKKFIRVNNI